MIISNIHVKLRLPSDNTPLEDSQLGQRIFSEESRETCSATLSSEPVA